MPRIRSESRTEETSGFVTISASSAKCMASSAPDSIPAGESQTMYSKSIAIRSLMTFSTPSIVSASLSRVCEAGRIKRFSHFLSLMSAWFRLASPWITLIRSYTTRRSQPMMRSRLRRPTSKSMTGVLLPRRARADAKLAPVVVLPTPPLPEVTTMIFAITLTLCSSNSSIMRGHICRETQRASDRPRQRASRRLREPQRFDHQLFFFEPDLHRLAEHVGRQWVLSRSIDACDRDEFRLETRAENARVVIALHAGQSPAAQRRVNMDVAFRDHFGAVAHEPEHHQVALGINALAGAQRLVDHHGLRRRGKTHRLRGGS